jgi:hypothetical protein
MLAVITVIGLVLGALLPRQAGVTGAAGRGPRADGG